MHASTFVPGASRRLLAGAARYVATLVVCTVLGAASARSQEEEAQRIIDDIHRLRDRQQRPDPPERYDPRDRDDRFSDDGFAHVDFPIFGSPRPEDGYEWASGDPKNFSTRPVSDGTPSKKHRHLVWIGGSLRPADGYRWVDPNSDSLAVERDPTEEEEQKRRSAREREQAAAQRDDLRGDAAMAEEDYAAALRFYQSALRQDPGNATYQSDVAAAQEQIEALQRTRAEVERITLRIRGVQDALKRLSASARRLDEAERDDWLRRSAAASKDAWELGAHSVLDVLGAVTERQIANSTEELQRANDALINATDPDRREQYHLAFRALQRRREELKDFKGEVDLADHGLDAILKVTGDSKLDPEPTRNLEKIWKLADTFGLIPAPASKAKNLTDIGLDIVAQAISVHRIATLNSGAEDYLRAVKELNAKLEGLYKLKQETLAKANKAAERQALRARLRRDRMR